MNRRDFTRLSALAAAATRVPAAFAQTDAPSDKPVGYAAVGLGVISDIFMKACQSTPKAKITALVTGHPDEKGRKYAAQYGIPESSVYTYETYDKLRDNPDVDAVYIGLPNSMHCEYTVRAAKAGKHVLCEKPMAISSAECRTMIEACKRANRHLMIGYRVHYDPTFLRLQQLLEQQAIGQIEAYNGFFYGQQAANTWRLTKQYGGGGSLLDLGIYPLNAISWLVGAQPNAYTAVTSTREDSGRFKEVEQTLEWTMKYPNGIIAGCGSSYGADGPDSLIVLGEKGQLSITKAYVYEGLLLTGHLASGEQINELSTGKAPFQFTLEAAHFADCIRDNKTPRTPGEMGLDDMLAIEAIYKAAGHPIA